ncbi:SdpI family protein [Microaerobacter geothermalis]|uniref:SdpI family protein n=1 Tax=Microaerobacter geothermalis TaxID=674972 RepID=UPI001F28EEE2|nr:SdpI family protein [Microaerobacter geothermalis]MCF6093981.1 SdpI family protein [Microaerobacter geothermalis]
MKIFKGSNFVLFVLIIVSFLPGFLLYKQLPDQIPSHWNLSGEVDDYLSKDTLLFLIPGINLGMFFLFLLLPKIDPSKNNYSLFIGSYTIVRWSIHVLLIFLQLFTVLNGVRVGRGEASLDASLFVPIAVSFLFIIIGNYMGRFRHNYFIGIRTPWTLANESVWQKTHRLGGKLFVLTGIIGLSGIFFDPAVKAILLFTPLMISVIMITVYSYLLYKKI